MADQNDKLRRLRWLASKKAAMWLVYEIDRLLAEDKPTIREDRKVAEQPTDDLGQIERMARDVYEANGLHFTGTDGPTCVEVLLMVTELRALRKLRDATIEMRRCRVEDDPANEAIAKRWWLEALREAMQAKQEDA